MDFHKLCVSAAGPYIEISHGFDNPRLGGYFYRSCEVNGISSKDYEWKFKWMTPSKGEYKVKLGSMRKQDLLVLPLDKDDIGYYTCTATGYPKLSGLRETKTLTKTIFFSFGELLSYFQGCRCV